MSYFNMLLADLCILYTCNVLELSCVGNDLELVAEEKNDMWCSFIYAH